MENEKDIDEVGVSSGPILSSWDIISDKEIRQILIELKKQQVNETLNFLSDTNQTHNSLRVQGVSDRQVAIIRRWLDVVVLPKFSDRIVEALKKNVMEEEKEEKEDGAESEESRNGEVTGE